MKKFPRAKGEGIICQIRGSDLVFLWLDALLLQWNRYNKWCHTDQNFFRGSNWPGSPLNAWPPYSPRNWTDKKTSTWLCLTNSMQQLTEKLKLFHPLGCRLSSFDWYGIFWLPFIFCSSFALNSSCQLHLHTWQKSSY